MDTLEFYAYANASRFKYRSSFWISICDKFDMLETKMCVKIDVSFEINQFLPRNFYPPQYEQYIIVINHHADDMKVVKFVILIFYKKEFSIYSIIIARAYFHNC